MYAVALSMKKAGGGVVAIFPTAEQAVNWIKTIGYDPDEAFVYRVDVSYSPSSLDVEECHSDAIVWPLMRAVT